MSTDSASIPPPIPRLDPAGLIKALADHHGIVLDLIGLAAGGEVGAAFVRWPDGHESVLSTVGDADPVWADRLHTTAAALALAQSRGVPVPRYERIVPVGDTHVIIQQRLAGHPPDRVDQHLVDQLIMITETWADLLSTRDQATTVEPASLYLGQSGPGFCLHESLAQFDNRTRRLLDRVHEIGRAGPTMIIGDDLMHLDYHVGNALVDADQSVSGIIDWDASGRGDRWFSVNVLSFDLSGRRVEAGLIRGVEDRLTEAIPADRLRAYRAHLALRQVDWSIRHHSAAAVTTWLDIAEDRLAKSG